MEKPFSVDKKPKQNSNSLYQMVKNRSLNKQTEISEQIYSTGAAQNIFNRINISPSKAFYIDKRNSEQNIGNGLKRRKVSQPLIKPNYLTNECINHPEKQGNYKAIIDNQTLFYCTKCSMQLASQGFAIQRTRPLTFTKQRRRTLSGTISPTLQITPRYKQIQQFLDKTNKISLSMNSYSNKFTSLPQHYHQQQKIIQDFYDSVISYLLQIKHESIQQLRIQSQRYTEISHQYIFHLEKTRHQLDSISKDINTNIREILESISEKKFRDCLDFYKKKLNSYQQEIVKYSSQLKRVINYVEEDCNKTYQEIVNYLDSILIQKEQKQEQWISRYNGMIKNSFDIYQNK